MIDAVAIPAVPRCAIRCLALAALLAAPLAAPAQSAPADSASSTTSSGSWAAPASLGFWVGTARKAPMASRHVRDARRDFYLTGIRAGWVIRSGEQVVVRYVADIHPAAFTTENPGIEGELSQICPSPSEPCAPSATRFRNVYGAGLSPLGVELELFGRSAVALLLRASGGGLWFDDPIPDPAATRFNFVAAAGGGIRVALPRGLALDAGYDFHHTSNGGTGMVNPGLNAHVFNLGMIWRRGGR